MLIKFVYVLLTLAVAQAFPSSDAKPKNDEPTCPQKIAWYRDITKKTKVLYAEYHGKLIDADLTSDAFNKLAVENSNFENAIAPILRKIDTHPDNSSSTSNDADKQALCDNIDNYRVVTLNLTRAATSLKSNVLNVIDHSKIPKQAKDSLNKTLTKIVNFLFEIDMTENTFKDLEALLKEAETKTTQRIQLEKQYITTETGVEKITKSAVSEPWDDPVGDKEFDDLLKSDPEELKDSTRASEEPKRVVASEDVDDYHDEDDGLPIHLHPGRTLVNAFKHPTLPLTIIGIILIVICGTFVWNWVRPDQWVRSRYARMS